MDGDEDMFLVIVGDEMSEGSSAPTSSKQISLDETEGVIAVDDLLEVAEKHGEYFDVQIKLEAEELDSENLAEDSLLQPIKSESKNDDEAGDDSDYVPEDDEEGDDDEGDDDCEIPEDDDDCEIPEDDDDHVLDSDMGRRKKGHHSNTAKRKEVHRYTMLKKSQCRSFVAELRKQFPELNDDKELLINTLSGIMKSMKPPPPPEGFYVMHSKKPSCLECGRITESIPAAQRHYQEKHGERYLVCFACGVDFRSTTNLYKHEKRCTAPDARIVLKARAFSVFRRVRGRPFLPKNVMPPPRLNFPCPECTRVFLSKVALDSHLRLHRGERPFQCHICPAAYTSRAVLARHTRSHTDEQYICDHCNRSFKVKSALVLHMDTHRAIPKFKCAECGRRFAQRSALLVHVNRDHRLLPPPCACQICPKRYPRMTLLKDHMKRAHGMTLMTRRMLSRSLPTMIDTDLKKGKVVLKSEAPYVLEKIEEDETNCEVYDNSETYDQSDSMQVDEFAKYVDNMNDTEADDNSVKVFYIKNGEVINIKPYALDESEMNLLTDDSVEPETKVGKGELKRLSMPDL